MSEHLYTVKDIAAAISMTGELDEVQRLMRQIRHWTNNDILIPLGGKRTGTGVSRVYKDVEVYKAAIVSELVRYGITVEMIAQIAEWFEMLEGTSQWQNAIAGNEDFFLQFAFHSPLETSMFKPLFKGEKLVINLLQSENPLTDYASAIIVNVAVIAKRVRL
ncbi:MAG: hypothetical protein RIM33_17160 [Alphaproteobacteria bacterium]